MIKIIEKLNHKLDRNVFGTSLQSRITILTAISMTISVTLISIFVTLLARWSLYDRLDHELLNIAAYMRESIRADLETLGGLNKESLHVSNVILTVISPNVAPKQVTGESSSLVITSEDLAIARTGDGYSARNGTSNDKQDYRIVTIPLTTDSGHYAIVLGRKTAATRETLNQIWVLTTTVGVLGVICATTFAHLISKSALSPVKRLSNAVKHVAETEEFTPIHSVGNDELGDLAKSFNTMLTALESSRIRQSQLISDAGHELRTPLTSMRTNIELLIADETSGMLPEGARHEILHDVNAQLGEFTSLVSDLVQLSRETASTPDFVPLDLAEVTESALERARRRGPNLNFDVRLDPYYVLGDAATLERAITNLLDNAVKFSPPKGTIEMELSDGVLRISDEGPGIAAEDLPHVFDRFYRSDRSRNTPGTGLGLSIVAHTIHTHGGWVTAGNSATGGAEFKVYIPPVPDETSNT